MKPLWPVALFAASCIVFGPSSGAAQNPPSPKPATDEAKKTDENDKSEKKDEEKEEPKQKPFAQLVKKAKTVPGLFTFHRTDDKVYLEVKPEQWDTPFMLSLTCESGLGERGFYAAQMCGEVPIVLRKQGKHALLIARNARFTADEGTPISRTLSRSFSDSVLGTTTVDSLPHPERKSELIDLDALLLTDLPNAAYFLEGTFRIPYKPDSKASTFGTLKGFERNVEVETRIHYTVDRLPVPPPPGSQAPPLPPPPRNVPDARSLLLTFRYSLSEMPPPGYRPRLADDRVGHFFNQAEDYTTDIEHESARRYITRWRLEKADPSAALSAPKQPIVFWMENTIPLKYRDAIREGALMWNKAFEKIGFKDAIQVKQQPDDSDWDPADVRYSTIRWFTATDASFAIGPSRTNPYTGEIYDADISFSEAMTRFQRRELIEEVQPVSADVRPLSAFQPPWSTNRLRSCDLAQGAIADAAFAFDVLAARGLDPAGPEADDFVRGFLRYVSAHEVGHTLGLRHNFHASTLSTLEQLQDPTTTSARGLTSSVMEYIPTNIAGTGSRQGELFQTTLGPYDYWAIEYAYRPIDASSPAGELPELRKTAARGADPLLAYATDEDAGFFNEPFEMDPLVNRFDLGNDPIKYYSHRVTLAHELWKNAESKLLSEGQGYQILRRSFQNGLGAADYSLQMTAKYIGGVRHHRDHFGDPNGRLPFEPVPAEQQRAALELLKARLFAPDAFAFSPALLRKLAAERYPDWVNFERMLRRSDVPVHTMVLDMQQRVLDRLLHPVVLSRILDSQLYVDAGVEPFKLSTLYQGLQDSIWAELSDRRSIPHINSHRRALQRLHLRKLAELTVRDGKAPEDARSQARHSLTTLRDRLRDAAKAKNLEPDTKAHIEDSLARVEEILSASVQRVGF